jgi:hypothetical protein
MKSTTYNDAIYVATNAFFDHAKDKGLSYPKIRLHTESGFDIVLSKAGPSSTFPGSISICSPGAFGENKFYGRLRIDGDYTFNKYETNELLAVDIQLSIEKFVDDPIGAAKFYAAQSGRCSFCGTTITTDESLTVGYGPVCAENYGLPWGDKSNANEQEIDLAGFQFNAGIEPEPVKPGSKHNAATSEILLKIDTVICQWNSGRLPASVAFTEIEDIINHG